jgi:uncharacterized membrane protein YphA (DoxX/SURF4 family)
MYTTNPSTRDLQNKSQGGISSLLFRVLLGLLLFIKGILFLRNEGTLQQVFAESESIQKLSTLQLFIPWMHVLGGFLILIGLYTRLAILVQFPLVVGAIFVLLRAKQYAFFQTEMIFAVIILALLFICFKSGDGFYSWRNLIRKENGNLST